MPENVIDRIARVISGNPQQVSRPVYGAEVPATSWEEQLKRILADLSAWRASHPVTVPTVEAKQLEESRRQHEEEMKYKWAALAQEAALQRLALSRAGGGGGGGASLGFSDVYKTETERRRFYTSQLQNAALEQYEKARAELSGGDVVRYPLTQAVERTLNWLYFSPEASNFAASTGADVAQVARNLVGVTLGKSLEDFIADLKRAPYTVEQASKIPEETRRYYYNRAKMAEAFEQAQKYFERLSPMKSAQEPALGNLPIGW